MRDPIVSQLLDLRIQLRIHNPDCVRLKSQVAELPPDDRCRPDLENLGKALCSRDIPGAMLHVEAALLSLHSS